MKTHHKKQESPKEGTEKEWGVFGDSPQSGEEHWPKDRKDNEAVDETLPADPDDLPDHENHQPQEDS